MNMIVTLLDKGYCHLNITFNDRRLFMCWVKELKL